MELLILLGVWAVFLLIAYPVPAVAVLAGVGTAGAWAGVLFLVAFSEWLFGGEP